MMLSSLILIFAGRRVVADRQHKFADGKRTRISPRDRRKIRRVAAIKAPRRVVKVKPPPESAEKVPQEDPQAKPEPKKGFFGRIKDWIK